MNYLTNCNPYRPLASSQPAIINKKSTCSILSAVVSTGLLISTLQAQISSTGDVTPTPTSPSWNSPSTNATIGNSGTGSLTLETNGTVTLNRMVLGNLAGSSGTLEMTGGSLNASTGFRVGVSGNGEVNISGGSANVGFTQIGASAGSTGILSISGGQLTVTSSFSSAVFVGGNGSGLLRISGNGSMSTGTRDMSLTGTGSSSTSASTGRIELLGGVLSTRQIIKGAGEGTILMDGGILRLTGNQTSLFSGITSGNVTIGSAGATIDTQSFSVSSSADLSGNGSLTKLGSGSLTLTGNNTYTGDTVVSNGTLLVNSNSGSGLGTGNVSVASGATLGGTGSFTNDVTVAGTLSPGASIESLASGAVSFSNNSTFDYEVNSSVAATSGADLQIVNGDLDLGENVILTIDDLALSDTAFADGTKFSLINYSGNWNGGLFTFGSSTVADDTNFTAGLNTWTLNYNDITGGDNFTGEYIPSNFVTLTAIPEPSSSALVVIGAASLLLKRRKKAHS